MMKRIAPLVLALALPFAAAAEPPPLARPGRSLQPGFARYWPSETCGACHPRALEQQRQSHHERAFVNPAFQALYFELVLPRAAREPELAAEARSCTACHAPVAFANARGPAARELLSEPSMSGVTCDVCHTIRAIDGASPLNGNFLSSPSDVKFGPLRGSDNAHHVYSPLQSRSELCGTCHEATNRHGLLVKGTYSEWRASPAAAAGVQCQDCHMTRDGLVRAAAVGAEGTVRYTHRFPGAHSRSTVEGAVRLSIEPAPLAGRRLGFRVTVDNTRSGHRYPTGSTDLRVLWLEVNLRAGDRVVPVSARGDDAGVAGGTPEDARLLGADVPAGSRTYRAVFVDAAGKPTQHSWDAVRIAFDNRLAPGAVTVERYALDLPRDLRGTARVEAKLRYLPYSSTFATLMDLSAVPPVDVAWAAVEVAVP